MRTIIKGREPNSLTQYRQTDDATYAGYGDKDTLRESLVAEQRGLCCYCLSRIRPEIGAMKIEHWHSQAQQKYPEEQLAYRNLLGACPGNEGQPRAAQYCDTRKGDNDLSRNPADPGHAVEQLIHFLSDGTIVSTNLTFNQEIDEILNLNVAYLKNQRKAALDSFLTSLHKRGELQQSTLERWLTDWNGESNTGELRPYCQVVVYWIRKRLKRA